MQVAEARDPYVPWLKVSISEAWIQAMVLTRKLRGLGAVRGNLALPALSSGVHFSDKEPLYH